jgi:hypothetical protein
MGLRMARASMQSFIRSAGVSRTRGGVLDEDMFMAFFDVAV